MGRMHGGVVCLEVKLSTVPQQSAGWEHCPCTALNPLRLHQRGKGALSNSCSDAVREQT